MQKNKISTKDQCIQKVVFLLQEEEKEFIVRLYYELKKLNKSKKRAGIV